jgi:hypothetical protein
MSIDQAGLAAEPDQKRGKHAVTRTELARLPAWAETLTRWLDDLVRIPGTNVGLGLDGLLGFLVPGAGDAVTGIGSLSLLLLALRRGVPSVVITRMVVNIGIDALIGTIPVVGDVFDFGYKANRRNLELIRRHTADPLRKPTAGDYALVGLGFALAALSVLLPIAVAAFVLGGIASAFR